MYFVYVLQSESTARFHVGQCHHLLRRLHAQQEGRHKATRNRGGLWWMPYSGVLDCQAEAGARKRSIKTTKSAGRFRRIIQRAYPTSGLK